VTPEPRFLSVADVIEIHAVGIARYGGLGELRDPTLLESAVGTASASFDGQYLHSDLSAMAAAYAFHIAQNQCFLDGNKRAGLGAALVFLGVNGWMAVDPEGRLYAAMIGIAERRLDKDRLAALFRELIRPRLR
jgi:death-on-curing protein